MHEEKLSALIT